MVADAAGTQVFLQEQMLKIEKRGAVVQLWPPQTCSNEADFGVVIK